MGEERFCGGDGRDEDLRVGNLASRRRGTSGAVRVRRLRNTCGFGERAVSTGGWAGGRRHPCFNRGVDATRWRGLWGVVLIGDAAHAMTPMMGQGRRPWRSRCASARRRDAQSAGPSYRLSRGVRRSDAAPGSTWARRARPWTEAGAPAAPYATAVCESAESRSLPRPPLRHGRSRRELRPDVILD